MEAVLMTRPHTSEQSLVNSRSKILHIRIRNPNSKRNSGGRGNFKSNPSPSHHHDSSYAGLLNHPLPRAMSLSQPLFTHHQQQQHRQNHQPPLLPLPTTVSSAIHHQPLLSRSLSSTQALSSRKDRARDMSLTPKKSKPTKREDSAKKRSSSAATVAVASDNHCWGPDPKDLPKHLPLVLTLRGKGADTVSVERVVDDMFSSGSVLSPPPSSLPLPKFSLMRSKLVSCNAEAAGVDDGATNNLRRLLRLR